MFKKAYKHIRSMTALALSVLLLQDTFYDPVYAASLAAGSGTERISRDLSEGSSPDTGIAYSDAAISDAKDSGAQGSGSRVSDNQVSDTHSSDTQSSGASGASEFHGGRSIGFNEVGGTAGTDGSGSSGGVFSPDRIKTALSSADGQKVFSLELNGEEISLSADCSGFSVLLSADPGTFPADIAGELSLNVAAVSDRDETSRLSALSAACLEDNEHIQAEAYYEIYLAGPEGEEIQPLQPVRLSFGNLGQLFGDSIKDADKLRILHFYDDSKDTEAGEEPESADLLSAGAAADGSDSSADQKPSDELMTAAAGTEEPFSEQLAFDFDESTELYSAEIDHFSHFGFILAGTGEYSVTYKSGDGSGDDYTVAGLDAGEVYTVLSYSASPGFTAPAGKYFSYWELEGDSYPFTRYSGGDQVSISSNLTLVACWSEKRTLKNGLDWTVNAGLELKSLAKEVVFSPELPRVSNSDSSVKYYFYNKGSYSDCVYDATADQRFPVSAGDTMPSYASIRDVGKIYLLQDRTNFNEVVMYVVTGFGGNDLLRAGPDCSYMFAGEHNGSSYSGFCFLSDINGLSHVDFSKTTDCSRMFHFCGLLKINLDNDFSDCSDFSHMFDQMRFIQSIDVADAVFGSGSADFTGFFSDCMNGPEKLILSKPGPTRGNRTSNQYNTNISFEDCSDLPAFVRAKGGNRFLADGNIYHMFSNVYVKTIYSYNFPGFSFDGSDYVSSYDSTDVFLNTVYLAAKGTAYAPGTAGGRYATVTNYFGRSGGHFTEPYIKVSFDLNGGSGSIPDQYWYFDDISTTTDGISIYTQNVPSAYASYPEKTTLDKPADPVYTGHTFYGWYWEDGTGNRHVFRDVDFGSGTFMDTIVTKGGWYEEDENDPGVYTFTLKANWDPTYTITYEANGGGGQMDPAQDTVATEQGYQYTLRTNTFTAPAGKKFDGWKLQPASGTGDFVVSEGYVLTGISCDYTVSPVWTGNEYTIIYSITAETGYTVPSDSLTPMPQRVTAGSDVELSPHPTTHWNTDQGVNITGAVPGTWSFIPSAESTWSTSEGNKSRLTSVSSDTTVTGIWRFTPATFTVSFEYNASSNAPSGAPSPYAYTITGINYNGSASLPVPSPVTITEGGYLYTFDGWYTDASLTGSPLGSTLFSITSNRTLYGKWNRTQITCSLTYLVSGDPSFGKPFDSISSEPSPVKLNYGQNVTSLAAHPSTSWNTSTGTGDTGIPGTWSFEPSDAGTWLLNGTHCASLTAVTSDITLTGSWHFTPAVYTLTYNVTGDSPVGSTVPSPVTDISWKGSVDPLAVLTTSSTNKDGIPGSWTFGGWHKGSLSGETVTSLYNITSNVDLYGAWSFTPDTYTITFEYPGAVGTDHPAGGTVPASVSNISHGASYTLPTVADVSSHKAGIPGTWKMDGWYQNSGFTGSAITEVTNVTSNITLYGKWTFTPDSFKVSYQYLGTKPSDATALPAYATCQAGSTVTVASDATASGYSFSGWSTEDAFISGTTFTMPARDVVITGFFTAGSGTVNILHYKQKLDGNYETSYSDITTINAAVNDPVDATLYKKSYPGFIYDSTNTNNKPSGTVPTSGDLELKLYYKRNSNTVSYSVDNDPNLSTSPTHATSPEASAAVPASSSVLYEGGMSTLAAHPTTTWTTSDGTSSGTPGTWSFTPSAAKTWKLSGTEVSSLTNISSNIVLSGGWSFTADTYTLTYNYPETPKDSTGADILVPAAVSGIAYNYTQTVAAAPASFYGKNSSGAPGLWNFGGWYRKNDFSGTAVYGSINVTENIDLYGKWTFSSDTYTLTYVFGSEQPAGVSVPVPRTGIAQGGAVKPLDVPYSTSVRSSRQGIPGTWNFAGWHRTADFSASSNPVITSVSGINADLCVYGEWKFTPDTFTLTYNYPGTAGTHYPASIMVKPPDPVTDIAYDEQVQLSAVSAASREPQGSVPGSWSFEGWYEDSTFSGTPVNCVSVTADKTVYGKWIFSAGTYQVVYHYETPVPDGVSAPMREFGIAYNGSCTLQTVSPVTGTRDGIPGTWSFNGWHKDSIGGISKTTVNNITANVHVYGNWTFTPDTYTVSYAYTGTVPPGTTPALAPAASVHAVGSTVSVEAGPTPAAGYSFSGWETGDAAPAAGGSFTMPAKDVSFKGRFIAGSSTFTVEHYREKLDGTYDKSADVYEKVSYSKTTDTDITPDVAITYRKLYSGFSFDRTATGSVLSGRVTGDGSLTLKLYYTRNSYKVTYAYNHTHSADAPAAPASSTYRFEEVVTVAADPVYPGHNFSGWSSPMATVSGGSFKMPDENVRFGGDFSYTFSYSFDGSRIIDLRAEADNGGLPSAGSGAQTGDGDTKQDTSGIGHIAAGSVGASSVYVYVGDVPPGAVVPKGGECYPGDIILLAPVPSVPHYSFDGWYVNHVLNLTGSFVMPSTSVTITGVFVEDEKHLVKYQYTGTVPSGASSLPASSFQYTGDTVTAAPPASCSGYTFTGWFKDAVVTDSFIMPGVPVTLTGHFTRSGGGIGGGGGGGSGETKSAYSGPVDPGAVKKTEEVRVRKTFDPDPPLDPEPPTGSAASCMWHRDSYSARTKENGYRFADEPVTEALVKPIIPTNAKLASLFELNSDFRGVLSIPGTSITYNVMHSPTVQDKYLYSDIHNRQVFHGELFMGSSCNLGDDNVIIYGHNMRDSSYFGELVYFKSSRFYKNHKTFSFETVFGREDYEIVAVCLENVRYVSQTDVFRYYAYFGKMSEKTFNTYAEHLMRDRLYDTGKTIQYGDQLVTLSTCSYNSPNERLLVVGRKIS